MMLLGLVLHSAASYTAQPLGEAWPYHDRSRHIAFDLLLFFIHLFRMPTFFVVAGFFAALLYERDGERQFIRNRARRVGLPLVVFWVAVMPLMIAGVLFGTWMGLVEVPLDHVPRGPIWRLPILGHLWFLYDLLLFYVAAVIVARAARGFRLTAEATWITRPGWNVLALGLITTLTLLPMQVPGLETSAALAPPLRILAAYGAFFAFGWLLYRQREVLPLYGARWIRFLVAGLIATLAYLVVLQLPARMTPRAFHVASVACAGLAVWLLIFGCLGLFVRRLDAPRPRLRYLADASYWIYLTHLLPVTWAVGLLALVAWPAGVKFTIVLTVATAVTLLTYRAFVRTTAIGALLNGRRLPLH